MRILVIGQALGRSPGTTLGGKVGRKLAALHGLDLAEFHATRDLVNLIERYPGSNGSGDLFPIAEAKERAATFDLSRWDRVVMLGRGVAKAFGLDTPFLEWREHRGSFCAVVPHTSGLNRWYNDPTNVTAASCFLHELERQRITLR